MMINFASENILRFIKKFSDFGNYVMKIVYLVVTSVKNMSKFYDVSIIKQESYLVQVGSFRAKD